MIKKKKKLKKELRKEKKWQAVARKEKGLKWQRKDKKEKANEKELWAWLKMHNKEFKDTNDSKKIKKKSKTVLLVT